MSTIAVIEWASDDAEAPAVYQGSADYVLRATALAMYDKVSGALDERGQPEYEDVLAPPTEREALWEWHRDFREAYTSPWVTFYDLGNDLFHGGECQPDNDLNRQLLYPLEVQS